MFKKFGVGIKIIRTAEKIEDASWPKAESLKPVAEVGDDYIYVVARAISAYEEWGPNDNGDAFEWDELLKSYQTFVKGGVYLDHDNDDPSKAIGIILDAYPNFEEKCVDVLMAISRKKAPKVAKQIEDGVLTDVSMGVMCFPGETGILLSDGSTKSIKDVQEGERVLSLTGTATVERTHRRAFEGRLVRVETACSTILATPEHPFYVYTPRRLAKTFRVCPVCGEETNRIVVHASKKADPEHQKFWKDVREDRLLRFVNAEDIIPGQFLVSPLNVSDDLSLPDHVVELAAWYIGAGFKTLESIVLLLPRGSNQRLTYLKFVARRFGGAERLFHGDKLVPVIEVTDPTLAEAVEKFTPETLRRLEKPLKRLFLVTLIAAAAELGRSSAVLAVPREYASAILQCCFALRTRASSLSYNKDEVLLRIEPSAELGLLFESLGWEATTGGQEQDFIVDSGYWMQRVEKVAFERPAAVEVFNLTTSDGTYVANGVFVHNCDESICSICGNVARDESEYCDHVRYYKNKVFTVITADGKKEQRRCFEFNRGLRFFEVSCISPGSEAADPNAKFRYKVAKKELKPAKVAALKDELIAWDGGELLKFDSSEALEEFLREKEEFVMGEIKNASSTPAPEDRLTYVDRGDYGDPEEKFKEDYERTKTTTPETAPRGMHVDTSVDRGDYKKAQKEDLLDEIAEKVIEVSSEIEKQERKRTLRERLAELLGLKKSATYPEGEKAKDVYNKEKPYRGSPMWMRWFGDYGDEASLFAAQFEESETKRKEQEKDVAQQNAIGFAGPVENLIKMRELLKKAAREVTAAEEEAKAEATDWNKSSFLDRLEMSARALLRRYPDMPIPTVASLFQDLRGLTDDETQELERRLLGVSPNVAPTRHTAKKKEAQEDADLIDVVEEIELPVEETTEETTETTEEESEEKTPETEMETTAQANSPLEDMSLDELEEVYPYAPEDVKEQIREIYRQKLVTGQAEAPKETKPREILNYVRKRIEEGASYDQIRKELAEKFGLGETPKPEAPTKTTAPSAQPERPFGGLGQPTEVESPPTSSELPSQKITSAAKEDQTVKPGKYSFDVELTEGTNVLWSPETVSLSEQETKKREEKFKQELKQTVGTLLSEALTERQKQIKEIFDEYKKDKTTLKKIDQLPKKYQEQWLKTFASALYHYWKVKGKSKAQAEQIAAQTAWDRIPKKYKEAAASEEHKEASTQAEALTERQKQIKELLEEAKSDKVLKKKIDQLPKKYQEQFLKTYATALYHYWKVKGKSKQEAKRIAAQTAWDRIPKKYKEASLETDATIETDAVTSKDIADEVNKEQEKEFQQELKQAVARVEKDGYVAICTGEKWSIYDESRVKIAEVLATDVDDDAIREVYGDDKAPIEVFRSEQYGSDLIDDVKELESTPPSTGEILVGSTVRIASDWEPTGDEPPELVHDIVQLRDEGVEGTVVEFDPITREATVQFGPDAMIVLAEAELEPLSSDSRQSPETVTVSEEANADQEEEFLAEQARTPFGPDSKIASKNDPEKQALMVRLAKLERERRRIIAEKMAEKGLLGEFTTQAELEAAIEEKVDELMKLDDYALEQLEEVVKSASNPGGPRTASRALKSPVVTRGAPKIDTTGTLDDPEFWTE